MTDEQIIKAVGICRIPDTCRGCPYHELYTAECICALMKDVFDLINRQKEKIKEFDGKIVIQQGMIDYQKAEIEQWKEEANRWQNAFVGECMLTSCEAKSEIAVEAIKEFAERLKRTSIGLEIGDDKKFKMTVVSTVAIDNLVKEMTEVEE